MTWITPGERLQHYEFQDEEYEMANNLCIAR